VCVKQVYYDRLGVRGRGGKVVRLSPIPPLAPSQLPIAPPSPRLQTLRRSRRIVDKQTKENIPSKKDIKIGIKNVGTTPPLQFGVNYEDRKLSAGCPSPKKPEKTSSEPSRSSSQHITL